MVYETLSISYVFLKIQRNNSVPAEYQNSMAPFYLDLLSLIFNCLKIYWRISNVFIISSVIYYLKCDLFTIVNNIWQVFTSKEHVDSEVLVYQIYGPVGDIQKQLTKHSIWNLCTVSILVQLWFDTCKIERQFTLYTKVRSKREHNLISNLKILFLNQYYKSVISSFKKL